MPARNVYSAVISPHSPVVPSNEGGPVYQIDKWSQLRRFLILGSESGSFYTKAEELTVRNIRSLNKCLEDDPQKAIYLIQEISESGIAQKNIPAILCLPIAATNK